jgi:hypothetical protein
LVELHHRFGRVGGDGLCRSRGGPNGGQRAKVLRFLSDHLCRLCI